ncbi:hypothetical protein LIER_04604 [Lithospermum erythrorhizon]|uniref:ATP-dependent DNA helicase n=1 Tax=Lithospermum erythrorhizon TaxID=34254 RepID=A0AAV3NXK9_LITER
MPKALRRLFATILIYTNPYDVRKLWDDSFNAMVEDYPRASDTNNVFIKNKLLNDISKLLEQHNKKLKEFAGLPQMIEGFEELTTISIMIEDELTIPVSNEDITCIKMLNTGQLEAFNTIKRSIVEKESRTFFVDGPGGIGKTYLYLAFLAYFTEQ